MAENNEYHIYVHLDDFANGSGSVAGAGAGSVGGDNGSSDSGAADKLIGAAKRMVSFAAVKSTADNLVNYKISQVSLETGATEYEQRLSYAYNVASQTVGAGASLVMAGIAGGPAGAAAALLGIAVSGVQKIISIAQKEQTLRTQESLENISIGMATVRAGTSGRRGSNQ